MVILVVTMWSVNLVVNKNLTEIFIHLYHIGGVNIHTNLKSFKIILELWLLYVYIVFCASDQVMIML